MHRTQLSYRTCHEQIVEEGVPPVPAKSCEQKPELPRASPCSTSRLPLPFSWQKSQGPFPVRESMPMPTHLSRTQGTVKSPGLQAHSNLFPVSLYLSRSPFRILSRCTRVSAQRARPKHLRGDFRTCIRCFWRSVSSGVGEVLAQLLRCGHHHVFHPKDEDHVFFQPKRDAKDLATACATSLEPSQYVTV